MMYVRMLSVTLSNGAISSACNFDQIMMYMHARMSLAIGNRQRND